MTKWNEIQEQAKKLIDEGMHALKSGFTEAEFLAETTASAARLHMDAGRRRFEMYRVLHDLGAVLYNAVASDPSSARIELTPAMRALVGNARSLDETLAEDERQLGLFSIVKREGAPARSDTEQRAKPRPRVAGHRRKKRAPGTRTVARRTRRGR